MLPKKRAARFCVTLVTGFVDRLTNKLQFGRFPVRAVATTARHLALEERMRIRFERLDPLQLVTRVANLGLRRGLQNGIARLMTYMTICAGNLVIAMWPGVPCKTKIRVMTINAHTILRADTGFTV